MTSITIDWSEEYKNDYEKWENLGRNIIKDNCKHKTQDKSEDKETNMIYSGYCEECGFSEDSCYPMMNYGHILITKPKNEDILKVVQNTNCTVMYDTINDLYYIALTGGGMDLSQDIALSYVWLENWIPEDLIKNVCKQKGFSIGKEHFEILKSAIMEQSKDYQDNYKRLHKEWSDIK